MVGVGKTIPPNRQILKDIYLSFFYGAKIGIIGLNGSGKSSLLNSIAGEERSMVSDSAGTTRDVVDSLIESDGVD